MLAPRPWGLSLLKIRCHKHLLDDLILVIVLCVPHDLDDFIGRVLCLADASLGLGRVFFFFVVLYLHLGGAGTRIGTRAGRTLGAIATKMSLLAAGETLACLHKLRSFVCGDLPSPDAIDFHRVRVLRLWPVLDLRLFAYLARMCHRLALSAVSSHVSVSLLILGSV
jgi:hypothetical protein